MMQDQFHYKMKDILDMSAFEFETFVSSLSEKKIKEKPKLMKIDEAFPQFFTDPYAKKGVK